MEEVAAGSRDVLGEVRDVDSSSPGQGTDREIIEGGQSIFDIYLSKIILSRLEK